MVVRKNTIYDEVYDDSEYEYYNDYYNEHNEYENYLDNNIRLYHFQNEKKINKYTEICEPSFVFHILKYIIIVCYIIYILLKMII